MNINEIGRILAGASPAVRRPAAPSASATQTAAAGSAAPAEKTAEPGVVYTIGDDLPDPSDFTVSSSTADALRRTVERLLIRQYGEGGAFFKALLERGDTARAAVSETAARTETRADTARLTLTEETAALVSPGGRLSPQTVAARISDYLQAMTSQRPDQLPGYQNAVYLAFSNFGTMFGGVLPAISQQTLATFKRDYDPFRSGVSEAAADDPVSGVAESGEAVLRTFK